MKKAIFIFNLLLVFTNIFSQNNCEEPQRHIIKSNRIGAYIYNDGTLFNDVEGNGGFKFPYAETGNGPSTIANASLWLGGFDLGDELKVAAGSYYGSGFQSDFAPGPLDPATGLPYANFPCQVFNKIWVVTGEEIAAFFEDWKDDKMIQGEHPSIFQWPGNGNPHFYLEGLPTTDHGWAPFFDYNVDGVYDPMKGDFPMQEIGDVHPNFFPDEITWTVFHDNTMHEFSKGYPLGFEVQQTAWTRNCDSQPEIENTVFVDYKLINRGMEDIYGFYAGISAKFEIGCPHNEYIGSLPDFDTFYGYNVTPNDSNGFCDEMGYGDLPPVMSVKFMGGPRGRMDKFISFAGFNFDDPPLSMNLPESPVEFYNYLTGTWRDGTPLTFGGNGYNPLSTDYTDFAYPGNPNTPGEWSMMDTSAPLYIYMGQSDQRPGQTSGLSTKEQK